MARSKDLPPTTLDELRRNLERLKLFAMLEHLDESIEIVTPTRFSARNSMISGLSSVALVVRLKSTSLETSAARRLAYAMVLASTGKFSSVSPPKKVMWATLLSPDSFSMNSTL